MIAGRGRIGRDPKDEKINQKGWQSWMNRYRQDRYSGSPSTYRNAWDSKLDYEFAPLVNLLAEHIPDEFTGIFHFRHGKSTRQLLANTTGGDHTGISQDCQVLREIGLGNTQLIKQFGDVPRALSEHLQNLNPNGVRKGLADLALPLVNKLVGLRRTLDFHNGTRCDRFSFSLPQRLLLPKCEAFSHSSAHLV